MDQSKLGCRMDENGVPVLLIGADVVPTKSNYEAFSKGDVEVLVDSCLYEMLSEADYSLFNLEVPLTDCKSPIAKCGPNLIAPTMTVAGFKALGVGAFCLANNHIMDQGVMGLESTIAALDEAGISHFGAGSNLIEASEPFYFYLGDIKVGVYACAEHEFSIAGDTTPGANPFDPLESLDHVRSMVKNCNYAIVLYHGGKEHYRFPSPLLRKRSRKLIEAGADLIVCQHSHCIGCEERWLDGTIVYGQGNFIFDRSESEFWQTGLIIEVRLYGDRQRISYIPVKKHGPSVQLAQGADAREILDGFRNRSNQITARGFVENEYKRLAEIAIDQYLASGIPGHRSFVFRVLNRLLGHKLPSMVMRDETLLNILNWVECEAHNELLVEGLRGRISKTGLQ